MRIAHFYATTPNLGDLGAARGIQNILRSLRGDMRFQEFNIQKKDLKRSEVKRINNECDALLLGGGGLFYKVLRTRSRFNFNVRFEHYYALLKLPKFFYAIGINAEYSERDKWNIDAKTRESIRKFAQHTDLISVRDHETVDFLKGLDTKAFLTPCPSMFLLRGLHTAQKDKTFAFNLTGRAVSTEELTQITRNVREYAEKIGLKPRFVAHHKNEDKDCIEIAAANGLDIYIPTSPENLMEFYKKQQFLVGMRGHSLIFATGAHLPMVSLSYNKKCDVHMALIGMENYNIERADIAKKELLFKKLDELQLNKEAIAGELAQKTDEFYKMNVEFAKKLLKRI